MERGSARADPEASRRLLLSTKSVESTIRSVSHGEMWPIPRRNRFKWSDWTTKSKQWRQVCAGFVGARSCTECKIQGPHQRIHIKGQEAASLHPRHRVLRLSNLLDHCKLLHHFAFRHSPANLVRHRPKVKTHSHSYSGNHSLGKSARPRRTGNPRKHFGKCARWDIKTSGICEDTTRIWYLFDATRNYE